MVEQRISPALQADLEGLRDDHGMNEELIKSLLVSKEQACAHIGFFKRMIFMSNGAVMTIGLAIAGFGGRRLMGGFSVLSFICLLGGVLLFLKFMAVFAGMTRSIRATEAVARKHDLI